MILPSHGGDIYRNQGMIDFSANINPLGTPKSVKDAAKASMETIMNYPDVQCDRLINAIANKEKVKNSQIICGNGAADLIFQLCLAEKPKKALICAPTFLEYEQALRAVDSQIDYYYLKVENNFQLEEDYLNRLTDDLDIIFLCNPNNPTGKLIPKALLYQILLKCSEKNIRLIIDECFNDFLDEPENESLIKEIDTNKNLFILKAFTKIYAMAGLRLGYGISSDSGLLSRIHSVTQPWNVSIPAQEAGIAALKEETYVEESKVLIREQRNYLLGELQKLSFQTFESEANYIFFCSQTPLYEQLRNRKLLIRDCGNYKGLTEFHDKYYYRIAVRTKQENQILIQELKDIRNGTL